MDTIDPDSIVRIRRSVIGVVLEENTELKAQLGTNEMMIWRFLTMLSEGGIPIAEAGRGTIRRGFP